MSVTKSLIRLESSSFYFLDFLLCLTFAARPGRLQLATSLEGLGPDLTVSQDSNLPAKQTVAKLESSHKQPSQYSEYKLLSTGQTTHTAEKK